MWASLPDQKPCILSHSCIYRNICFWETDNGDEDAAKKHYFYSRFLLLKLVAVSPRDSPAQLSAKTCTIGHLASGSLLFSQPISLYESHIESHLSYEEENQSKLEKRLAAEH